MALQGDIFKEGGNGLLTTFERAFPTIESIDVAIDEAGEGNHGLGRRTLTRRSVREYVNCSNPHCHGKGLDLGTLLRQMVAQNATERSGDFKCQSRAETGEPCGNMFRVEVRLRYKT